MMVKINKWFLGVLAVSMALVVGMQSCGEEPIKPPPAPIKTGVQLNFTALWEGQPLTFCRGMLKTT